MKIRATSNGYVMKLSARDTQQWADNPEKRWPCSGLAGLPLMVEVDRNGLCDIRIHGGCSRCEENVDGRELDAIVSDYLPQNLRHLWPVWGGK
jgi:hypothetical protein